MPSRCVLVLGVPRSGTSCVAGVLHKLGIDMGAGHFQPDDWANPRGYYEDMRWRLATQRITGRGYNLKAASIQNIGHQQRAIWRGLAKTCAQSRLWGMKDPWLCFVGQFIWPILEAQGIDVRMVVTHRPREASIASVQRHLDRTYHGKGNAAQIIDTWQEGLDRQVKLWAGLTMDVDFDELTANPAPQIERLASFAFEGIGRTPGDCVQIARWVRPDLNHHKGVYQNDTDL